MRPDLTVIANVVEPGSRVLDLGCGSGTLLRYLMSERGCTGMGVEIDGEQILAAIRSGVSVIQHDVDLGLSDFADKTYDVVVLSRTIQTIHKPALVLQEMGRIADKCIVSVPNFGLWRHRMRMLRGRVPMSRDLPFRWYESPNIRFTTLLDLEHLFDTLGMRIEQKLVISERGTRLRSHDRFGNFFGSMGVYLLRPES